MILENRPLAGSSLVVELSGIISLDSNRDVNEEYVGYLEEKYSR